MTHLGLLQNALKIVGIPFTVTEESDSVHISGDREWYDHPIGGKAFRWVNEVRVDYDTRLDITPPGGHADIGVFFKDGRYVHSIGYER